MLNNNFTNAPTVGSTEDKTLEDLNAQLKELNQRLAVYEAQRSHHTTADDQRCGNCDDQPRHNRKKSRSKKFRKFFATFVVPILNFIPRLLSAIARLKEAIACLMDATTRAGKASSLA